MTRSCTVIAFVLGVAVLVGIPVSESAQTRSLSEQERAEVEAMSSLSRRSRQMGSICESYLGSLKAMTQDSTKAEYFKSRSSALAVLKRGGRYPGTPFATSEALESFLVLDVMPTGRVAEDLRIALVSLSDCHAAEFYGFLTRLMDSRTQHILTSEERLQSRNLVLAYIRREASGDAKPPIQTELITKLLDRSVRTGLVAISREGRADLADLAWKIQQFSDECSAVLAERESHASMISSVPSDLKSESRFLSDLSRQYDEAEDLRSDLEDLIRSESEHGYLLPDGPLAPRGHLAWFGTGVAALSLQRGANP